MAWEALIIFSTILITALVIYWYAGRGIREPDAEVRKKFEEQDAVDQMALREALKADDSARAEEISRRMERRRLKYEKATEETEQTAFMKMVQHLAGVAAWIMVLGIVISLALSAFVIVPAGYVGVKDLFGDIQPAEFPAGLHLKNPFVNVHEMNVRTLTYSLVPGGDYPADVLTKEGLTVTMDMTTLYHIIPDRADGIYKELGPNYDEIVVKPQVRAAVRDIIATYEAKDLYSAERTEIANKVFDSLAPQFEARGIILESVLLRRIILPQQITDAIEAKLTSEQKIAQKEFDVQTQEKEADRVRAEAQGTADKLRIEAQGIADANKIISQSLTEPYLRWYWIDAIKAKTGGEVIYVPMGQDGMPIVKTV